MASQNSSSEPIDFSQGLKSLADNEVKPKKTTEEDLPQSKKSKTSQWLVKFSRGKIKDEKQALYILFGLAAILLLVFIGSLLGRSVFSSKQEEYRPETKYGGRILPDSFR